MPQHDHSDRSRTHDTKTHISVSAHVLAPCRLDLFTSNRGMPVKSGKKGQSGKTSKCQPIEHLHT